MVLGVCGNAIALRDGVWHTHHSFGTIVARLAPHFDEIHYHAPEAAAESAATCDCPIMSPNLRVTAWRSWRNSFGAIKRPDRLIWYYWRLVGASDVVFLRGGWPLSWLTHVFARLRGRRVVHWVVGDAGEIMKGQPRGYGRLTQWAGGRFARCEQLMTRFAAGAAGSPILANGDALARVFKTRHTESIISTSITEDDSLFREDTCLGNSARILFVGFVRPEKGVEYLLRALAALNVPKPVSLAIVGSWGQFSTEQERLATLAQSLRIADRVTWEGYAPFGQALFDQMDRSDLLVLPSLSEGTPRVLVEARARSLPVIATNVGGIPSSVTHERDGLLVPPRDPDALAAAMARIIHDGTLRRSLIEQGRARVRTLTVGAFVDRVVALLVDGQPSR